MRPIDADVLINKLTTFIYYGQLRDCEASRIDELEAVLADVRNMPTVNLGWIRCDERLPEEAGCYWTTSVLDADGRRRGTIRWFNGTKWEHVHKDYSIVIAWMPLPAPYKEDTDD